MTTQHTTALRATITATAAEQAHAALVALVAPMGERHFSTAPNRLIDGEPHVYISTVTTPEVAEAYRQMAQGIDGVSISPAVSPYAAQDWPPLPAQGEPVEMGVIYEDGEVLWMARQTHTRTEHTPEVTPALWSRYRHPAQGLTWIAQEPVEAGTLREYEGVMYSCVQAHVTQTDWTPPAVPARWRPVEVIEEPDDPRDPEPSGEVAPFVAGEDVVPGDRREYEGEVYYCIQAHTTEDHWSPDVAHSLWGRVVNVNTDTSTQLQTLSGVGPALAQRIIDDRPYEAVEDLVDVQGITVEMVEGWEVMV